jgi:hypothetical protein
MDRRRFLQTTGGLAGAALVAGCLGGDGDGTATPVDYPSGEVRNIVPYATGGGFDAYARLSEAYWSEYLDTEVVTENITGGGGVNALTQVWNADADGHTIVIAAPGEQLPSQIGQDVDYDLREMSHIGFMTQTPAALILREETDITDWSDFTDNVDSLNFATQGVGTMAHVGMEIMAELTGDFSRDDLNYVHANRFEDEEFALVGDSGGSISTTPEVELQMGMGMPVLGKAMEAGATPSVGVDIVSNVSGDMFTQTRMAVGVQRGIDNRPVVERGEQTTEVSIDPHRALEIATIAGARALGLEDRVGSITPGKRADLVVIDGSDVNTLPVNNPVETVAFQAGVGNVDTVIVDGEVVKRDGALTNDTLTEERDAFEASAERVLSESGLAD